MHPDDTDADREHDVAMDRLVAALWAEKRAQPPKENPMNNPIADLLTRVATTGDLPTDDEIAAVVTRGRTTREKTAARDTIRRAAKRIISALDAGLPEQATRLAADTGAELAAHTGTGATDHDPRAVADQISADHSRVDTTQAGAPAPVKDALLAGLRTGGIRDTDLDDVPLRRDATPEQVTAWRAGIVAASRDIARTYTEGHQGLARQMATEAAQQHRSLVATERPDQAEGITDPRELAARITGSRTVP